MLSNEVLKRISKLSMLCYTEKRDRGMQIRQFFQKAGFPVTDSFTPGKEIADLAVYDFYFIEYRYADHDIIAQIVTTARNKAKFGQRPIFIFDIDNEDSQVEVINARELFPDFVINSPINFGYIDELIKKAMSLVLLIEKLTAEVKGSHQAFIKRAQTFDGVYKNRMLLNMTLEELKKVNDKGTFLRVYMRHDKTDITPQNLMSFCEFVEPPKAIPILEMLLKAQKYSFKAHMMLAEIYAGAKHIASWKQHLSKAFENHPKNTKVFYLYLNFIIKHKDFAQLQSMVMKRFVHIGVNQSTLNKMVIDIADSIINNQQTVSKKEYQKHFTGLLLTLRKRISMDKRDEFQGLINVLIARYLFKHGKKYKARSIAISNFHRFLSGRKVAPDEFRLAALNVLASAGEMKMSIAMYKAFDQQAMQKHVPEFYAQSMGNFQRLNKVYQWLKAQKTENTSMAQLIKVTNNYPNSSDLNYMLLNLLLKNKEIMKNPDIIKQCLLVIRRMEKANNAAGNDTLMSTVEQNKKALNDFLLAGAMG